MNNNIANVAGFDWRRSDRTAKSGNWLRDAIIALATAMVATFLCMAGDAYAQQRTIQISGANRTAMVTVTIGKSQDVRTDTSLVDVMVGDPDVADVNPLTDHTLSILAKKIGTTRVSVYSEGKKLIGIFDVEVTYDITRLTNELKRRFPRSSLEASTVNGRIMLSGEVIDAATLDKAVTIARQFGPEIINSVSVSSPQQVMLEVRFIEISRTAGRELGVQWNRFGSHSTTNIGSRQPASNLPITSPTSASEIPAGEVAAGVLSGASPFGFMIARMVAGGVSTDVMINALEQKGIARSLAEPNLVALSGDTASFLAGGEYPIPVAGSLGQITLDYKKYGVGLAFTPTVLGNSLINLKIEPEVSSIDTTHSVALPGGASVPALIVRRASTTVELRDGQSFMIGGLLQNDNKNLVEQLPWLGSVPVLGALFSSKSYQKNETDLAIIVTPRLVRPARPGDIVKTPADDTLQPNDPDFFLLGKAEVSREEARSLTPAAARLVAAESLPFTGHMLDMPKWGISNAAIQ
ncbi:MAG: type II and III secretion system protein family protein [Rhizobiales bacterium]|nr:type II and III secretion system protein family protein [Hyphomicrobiales bacterium]